MKWQLLGKVVIGEAIYETSDSGDSSNGSWYGDYSRFPSLDSPFLRRGGRYDDVEYAGAFAFMYFAGYDDTRIGFRVAISVLQ